MYFAHDMTETASSMSHTARMWLVIILVTLAAKLAVIIGFYLLKRYSGWSFPTLEKKDEK